MKLKNEMIVVFIGVVFLLLLAILAGISLRRMSAHSCVGLVAVQGMILEDRNIVKQLHRLNDHPSVKAIVLSVDSPGGTLASAQSIFQEIRKIRRFGKPVVVSMSEVCASGGYYIACAGDRVFANPGTITGSIGAVLRYPEAGGLMEKLGVGMEVVKSGRYKDIGDFSRKMSASERKLMQNTIDDLHAQFVEMIMDARGDKLAQALAAQEKKNLTDLSPEEVRAYLEDMADGRVVTGRQALQYGLVDKLGNLDDAVEAAAFLAKIKGRPCVLREKEPSFFDRLISAPRERQGEIFGALLQFTLEGAWRQWFRTAE